MKKPQKDKAKILHFTPKKRTNEMPLPCESGKHIFSGLDWAKTARTTKKFRCKKCGFAVPFTDLPSDYFNNEMEKAREKLIADYNNLIKGYDEGTGQ